MIQSVLHNLRMPIVTPRLIIRPPQVGDGVKQNEAIQETYAALQEFMPWAQSIPSPQDSENYVRWSAANWLLKKAEEPWLPLFLFDRYTEEFVGASGFHNINWELPIVEIGYWIRNRRTKEGLVTEAINALTRYAILEIKATRIEIRCDIDNEKSRRVAERLGYHEESVFKKNRINYKTNQVTDTAIYVRHDIKNLPELDVAW